MHAWMLCCYHDFISTQTFQIQLRGDKKCPFSGVTISGRVWKKVQESSAQSVTVPQELEKKNCLWEQLTDQLSFRDKCS